MRKRKAHEISFIYIQDNFPCYPPIHLRIEQKGLILVLKDTVVISRFFVVTVIKAAIGSCLSLGHRYFSRSLFYSEAFMSDIFNCSLSVFT